MQENKTITPRRGGPIPPAIPNKTAPTAKARARAPFAAPGMAWTTSIRLPLAIVVITVDPEAAATRTAWRGRSTAAGASVGGRGERPVLTGGKGEEGKRFGR